MRHLLSLSFFGSSIDAVLHTLHSTVKPSLWLLPHCYFKKSPHTCFCPLLWHDLLSVISVSCVFPPWILPLNVSCYKLCGVTMRVLLTQCAQIWIVAFEHHSEGLEWRLAIGFNYEIIHTITKKTVCSWTSDCAHCLVEEAQIWQASYLFLDTFSAM